MKRKGQENSMFANYNTVQFFLQPYNLLAYIRFLMRNFSTFSLACFILLSVRKVSYIGEW